MLILAFSAVTVTAIWYSRAENDRYMLKLLSAMLWGATMMAFIDRVMAFLKDGGEFIELTAGAGALGLAMVIVALVIWEAILLLKDPRGVLRGKGDS